MKDIHENSTASYDEQKAKGKPDAFRKTIYNALKDWGRMTDREVMVYLKEKDVNNVRPEITRLKQDGLIVEIGKARCKWTGKMVRITEISNLPYFRRGNIHKKQD